MEPEVRRMESRDLLDVLDVAARKTAGAAADQPEHGAS